MTKLKPTLHSPDIILAATVVLVALFGVLMVYDASVVKAHAEFGDKYYFLKNQGIGVVLGLIFGSISYRIDYHYWARIALPLMIFGLILLLLVYIPGLGVQAYGSSRWLDLQITVFQPSEFIKLVYAIYIATLLTSKKEEVKSFIYGFLPFLVVTGIVFAVIFFQPDFGTAIQILGNGVLILFLSGAPLIQMLIVFPPLALLGFLLIWTSPYRRARFLTFLDPTLDVLGKSYHINQILIALGSGGLFGAGLGYSRQKYQYLPEVMTDSIFAVIGEELGFVGVFLVLLVFFIIAWRGIRIVRDAPDKFGHLLSAGILGWIMIQAVINLGAMSSLLPLTGVPLPFISYGRSSNIVLLAGVGILLNISRQTLREEKPNKDIKKKVRLKRIKK